MATTQALLDALDYVGYCYSQNGTTIFPQAFYTFGNMGRNILRGPGFASWDESIIKTWRIKERFRLQVGGEVFNVANHPNYSAGSVGEDVSDFSSLGRASATPRRLRLQPRGGVGRVEAYSAGREDYLVARSAVRY